jgi:hypothetical protein
LKITWRSRYYNDKLANAVSEIIMQAPPTPKSMFFMNQHWLWGREGRCSRVVNSYLISLKLNETLVLKLSIFLFIGIHGLYVGLVSSFYNQRDSWSHVPWSTTAIL